MAAVVKAINSRIRANPVLDYVCSTRRFIPFPFFLFGAARGVRLVPMGVALDGRNRGGALPCRLWMVPAFPAIGC